VYFVVPHSKYGMQSILLWSTVSTVCRVYCCATQYGLAVTKEEYGMQSILLCHTVSVNLCFGGLHVLASLQPT